METTLQELGNLLCIKFTANHHCLYGFKRLNVKVVGIHHSYRRELTLIEKARIRTLIIQLVEFTGGHEFQYYKGIIYDRVAAVLNV